jgi:hypothetical protein
MNFVNNWSQAVTLAPGATSLALDLPDGTYRLTLADAAAGATRWEIVDAAVSAGTAVLTRALEGTTDQDWPADSVVYCGLTAGTLDALSQPSSAGRAPLIGVPASRALGLTDEGAFLRMESEPLELTVPPQAEVAWPEGAELTFAGWGGYTIVGAWTGSDYVSFMFGDSFGYSIQSASQYAVIKLKRVDIDRWVGYGDFLPSEPVVA